MIIKSTCWTSKIQSLHWENKITRSGSWLAYDWTWHWFQGKVYSENWQ